MKYYYPEHLKGYKRVKDEGKKAWGELFGDEDGFRDFSAREFLEKALPQLRFTTDPPHAFELGTGTGPGACFLAKRGFKVDAIDLIPDAIEIAEQLAAERQLDIHYEVMDVTEIPHEGPRYDLITDSYCLQGIAAGEDRAKVFAAVKARLKPEGYYLICTAMFDKENLHPEDTTTDPQTDIVYQRYGKNSLRDPKSALVYRPLEGDPNEYEHTLQIGEQWYLLNRRHHTAETLRAEIEGEGFKVLIHEGDVGENMVCTV